jgi:hypothetical protein
MPVTEASLLGCQPCVSERMKLVRSWARFQSTRKPQPLRLEPRNAKFPPNGSDIGTNGQAAMFETMAQRTSDDLITSSVSRRAEVRAAIEDLADEVARLARKLNRIAPLASKRGTPILEKARLEAALPGAFAATTCEALSPETEEAKSFPLSPQRNTEINEVIADELVEEPSANFKSSLPEPTHASCSEENAIAARVADLYERLGGFINLSLPKPTDHNT